MKFISQVSGTRQSQRSRGKEMGEVKKKKPRDFPGGPVAKTLCSQGWGPGSITGQEIQSHILQLKTLCAATKTQHSQIN